MNTLAMVSALSTVSADSAVVSTDSEVSTMDSDTVVSQGDTTGAAETDKVPAELGFLNMLATIAAVGPLAETLAKLSPETVDAAVKAANRLRKIAAIAAGADSAPKVEKPENYQATKLFGLKRGSEVRVTFTDGTKGTFLVLDRDARTGRARKDGTSIPGTRIVLQHESNQEDVRTLILAEHSDTIADTKVLVRAV